VSLRRRSGQGSAGEQHLVVGVRVQGDQGERHAHRIAASSSQHTHSRLLATLWAHPVLMSADHSAPSENQGPKNEMTTDSGAATASAPTRRAWLGSRTVAAVATVVALLRVTALAGTA